MSLTFNIHIYPQSIQFLVRARVRPRTNRFPLARVLLDTHGFSYHIHFFHQMKTFPLISRVLLS